ncbi:MAG: (d)CMP kinase [Lachnospiraceae bacterium]|jgi:cytidylate kinase|nr:(d)CMP kinase [Lachnospiraceae bacterium]
MAYNIAIDGPAGSGKGSVAKEIAKRKGFLYIDTGAMFRALAVHFLEKGLKSTDTASIIAALADADVTIGFKDGMQKVFLNGEDVDSKLRNEDVGNMASATSVIPQVRAKLLELQRNLAKNENCVMEGRDITTVVLPDADLKIYLTADPKVRARRRYKELREKNIACKYGEVLRDINARDDRDMNREIAPLRVADDAILIDSSMLSIEEVVDLVLENVKCPK